MIRTLRLVRNVGRLASVTAANLHLQRASLVYADNGRGKTTISAIIRSLATGDPIPIAQRRRLGSEHAPHVVIDCIGDTTPAVFENNRWNRIVPGILIFDDFFVDANVYSGLGVDAEHRQNLHELILGAAGVRLNADLQGHVARIEEHNKALRRLADALPDHLRSGLSVDQFCNLQAREGVDELIQRAETRLRAAQQQQPVRRTDFLPDLTLPSFDIPSLETVLGADLPGLSALAAARVEAHLNSLGPGAQRWVAQGMSYLNADDAAPCPFCAQSLAGSPIVAHYRTFFGEEYARLRGRIDDAHASLSNAHGDYLINEFESRVGILGERTAFWSQFMHIPGLSFDVGALLVAWRAARASVSQLLDGKTSDPLRALAISDAARDALAVFDGYREQMDQFVANIRGINGPRFCLRTTTFPLDYQSKVSVGDSLPTSLVGPLTHGFLHRLRFAGRASALNDFDQGGLLVHSRVSLPIQFFSAREPLGP